MEISSPISGSRFVLVQVTRLSAFESLRPRLVGSGVNAAVSEGVPGSIVAWSNSACAMYCNVIEQEACAN